MVAKTQAAQAREDLDILRAMVRHENDLIHQRLGWMFTLQGLLFTAVGFLWRTSGFLTEVLGAVGLLSCLSIGYTLARGLGAIKTLLSHATAREKLSLHPGVPIIGASREPVEWLLPARFLPWVLGAAWLTLLSYRAWTL